MSIDAVKDWSANATLNTTLGPSLTLDGTVMKPSDVDNAFREMMAQVAVQFGKVNFKGANIASAATIDLSAATGNFVDITGATNITALGTVAAGQLFFLRFNGALTFTHNSTSLILPGGSNISTSSGDIAVMLSLGSGNWVCAGYSYAGGAKIVGQDVTLTYSDNTAAFGPNYIFMRETNAPGTSIVIGRFLFRGRDSAANVQDYASMAAVVTDPTSGSEDARLDWNVVVAGAVTTVASFSGTGITADIGATTPKTGAFTSLSASGAVALSPASANVVLSPTGTGVVTINPATAGSMNNVTLGASTPLAITGTTVTATGQLVISGAGAGQIVFPASQNASANANTFDDYEEGTFTPTLTFNNAAVGITYSTQAGRYTKLGRATLITGTLITSNKGSSVGAAEINGLPFTADAGTYVFVTRPASSAFTGITAGMVGEVAGGATKITLYAPDSTGASVIVNTNWASASGCSFTGTIFS